MIIRHLLSIKPAVILLLLSVSAGLYSCNSNDTSRPFQTGYYPLKAGMYYIYSVDSVRYPNVPFYIKKPDSLHFQLKDSIASMFKDQSGQIAYKIEEYRRFNPGDSWTLLKVFTRSANSLEGQETNGNLRFVKLIFPVSQGRKWDANKYNTLDSTHYPAATYVSVDQPWSASGIHFNKTTLVQLQNDSNLIQYNIQFERYAGNVGLVYRRNDSVFVHTTGTGKDSFYSGFLRKQVLLNYGPK
jgi:hypothetical protein